GLALRDHVVEAGGGLGNEIGVAQHRDVLDRVGQQVGGALVGGGLHGHRQVVTGRVAELDRGDDAVGRQLADPVVRTHHDVGAAAGRHLLDEVVLDVGDVLR